MSLYTSKPTVVEAVQWVGDNVQEVFDFAPDHTATLAATDGGWAEMKLHAGKDGAQGWVPVPVGHWIVRNPGDMTDHWPVDPDYFAAKYDAEAGAGAASEPLYVDLDGKGWGCEACGATVWNRKAHTRFHNAGVQA